MEPTIYETSIYNQGISMSQVNAAIVTATSQLATGYTPKGEASVATLNALSGQENGELYTMTDAGTLTDGSLAVVAGDTVAWDAANSVWYKAMDYAPRQYGTNEVHNLSTTITAFRTGDVIPVDGPDGTAKMAKDDLLKETADNALGSIHLLSDTATEADLVVGNFMAIDVPGVGGATKKLPAELVAKASSEKTDYEEIVAINSYNSGNVMTASDSGTGIVKDDLTIWSINGWTWAKYDVSALQSVYPSFYTSGAAMYGLRFADANGNQIERLYQGTDGVETHYVEIFVPVPRTAKWLYITCFGSDPARMYAKSGTYSTMNRTRVKSLAVEAYRADSQFVGVKETAEKSAETLLEMNSYKGEVVAYDESGYGPTPGTQGSPSSQWSWAKYDVSAKSAVYATFKTNGSGMYGITFKDSSSVTIKRMYQGVDSTITSYTDVFVAIPTGAKWMYITTYGNDVDASQAVNDVSAKLVDVKFVENTAAQGNGKWRGKSIVWLGTSIPATGYPQFVAETLGATMHNEAVPSSMARIGNAFFVNNPLSDYYMGLKGAWWQNVLFSLSMTQAEKHYIMECWTTPGRQARLIADGYTPEQVVDVKGFVRILGGSYENAASDPTVQIGDEPIDIMSDANKNYRKQCLSYCWDDSENIEAGFGPILGRVKKYLTDDNFPDLWVFDHGHNDALPNDTTEQLEDVPADPYNRNTFIGALNYLVNKILEFRPQARIVVVGHYTDQVGGTNRPQEVVVAQKNFADYWQFNLFKTWKFLPFSQRTVTTTGYWGADNLWHNTGFDGTNHTGRNLTPGFNQNPREVDGVWVHDLTLKQVWMKDDVHPSSLVARHLYAEVLAGWLGNI